MSKDAKISGDEGWWTGKIHGKVGIFPANFVAEAESIDRVSSVIDKVQPIEIDFEELQLEEVIGVGGFGKVYRYTCKLIYKMYKVIIIFYRKNSNILILKHQK